MDSKDVRLFKELPFPLGSTVFIITDKDKVEEAKVRSYHSEIFLGVDLNDPEKRYSEPYQMAVALTLTTDKLWTGNDYYPPERKGYFVDAITLDRVFSSHEEAKEKAKFISNYFNEDIWKTALGVTSEIGEAEFPIDESELGTCCDKIAKVRELLYKAYDHDGLVQNDVDKVKALLKSHIVWDKTIIPNLIMILESLGITEKDIND